MHKSNDTCMIQWSSKQHMSINNERKR